jgi:hypothetical protein
MDDFNPLPILAALLTLLCFLIVGVVGAIIDAIF